MYEMIIQKIVRTIIMKEHTDQIVILLFHYTQ